MVLASFYKDRRLTRLAPSHVGCVKIALLEPHLVATFLEVGEILVERTGHQSRLPGLRSGGAT